MANPLSQVLDLVHGYVYGRWTDKYLVFFRDRLIPRLRPRGRKRVADGFHCKVLTSEEARAIITIEDRAQ